MAIRLTLKKNNIHQSQRFMAAVLSAVARDIVGLNRKRENRGKYSKMKRKHIEVGGIYFILLLNFDCKSQCDCHTRNNMKTLLFPPMKPQTILYYSGHQLHPASPSYQPAKKLFSVPLNSVRTASDKSVMVRAPSRATRSMPLVTSCRLLGTEFTRSVPVCATL